MNIELLILIITLVTAALGLATAYLNFRTAHRMTYRRTRKQRWLPWR